MTDNILWELFFTFTNESFCCFFKGCWTRERTSQEYLELVREEKDNRPDMKDCARRLKQPRPSDKMVCGKFIARWYLIESQEFTLLRNNIIIILCYW